MVAVRKPAVEALDFSPALGGPLHEVLTRARLAGPNLEHLNRRLLCLAALAWLPLLILTSLDGGLFGDNHLRFLRDIETHIRLLLALPLLLVAENVAHRCIPRLMKLFSQRKIIHEEQKPKFNDAISAALKLRNSAPLEIALFVIVCTIGNWVWRNEVALDTTSWFASPNGKDLNLTLPGYWYAFVSIPIVQFVLFRWYLRIAIWSWLLWRISKLSLRLIPTHPDHAGGIGFLAESTSAFGLIPFAQSSVLAGIIAGRIIYNGQSLASFNITIFAMISLFILIILAPMAVFVPALAQARRNGLNLYGTLASSRMQHLNEKWLDHSPTAKPVFSTGDNTSLADLESSYRNIQHMRVVPFGLTEISGLAILTAMPLIPLVLTVIPISDLLTGLVKVLF